MGLWYPGFEEMPEYAQQCVKKDAFELMGKSFKESPKRIPVLDITNNGGVSIREDFIRLDPYISNISIFSHKYPIGSGAPKDTFIRQFDVNIAKDNIKNATCQQVNLARTLYDIN